MVIRKLVYPFLLLLMLVCNKATAQTKTAHIATNDLLKAMPEMQKANAELDASAKAWQVQYGALNGRYDELVKEYNSNEKQLTDSAKLVRAAEANAIKQQMEAVQKQAQDSIQKKRETLYAPIVEKVNKMIAQLAEEKGYDYVVDSNNGAFIYIKKTTNDLLPTAKAKLGIK